MDETLVVDDGSTDDSPSRAAARPGVRVLRSPGSGFAAAVNAGAAASQGEELLLLNSDCFVEPDTATCLHSALASDPRLALSAAALVRADGSRAKTFDRQLSMYRALREAVSLPLRPVAEGHGVSRVPFVPLACVLVRRSVWDEVGGLDERLCERADAHLARRRVSTGTE